MGADDYVTKPVRPRRAHGEDLGQSQARLHGRGLSAFTSWRRIAPGGQALHRHRYSLPEGSCRRGPSHAKGAQPSSTSLVPAGPPLLARRDHRVSLALPLHLVLAHARRAHAPPTGQAARGRRPSFTIQAVRGVGYRLAPLQRLLAGRPPGATAKVAHQEGAPSAEPGPEPQVIGRAGQIDDDQVPAADQEHKGMKHEFSRRERGLGEPAGYSVTTAPRSSAAIFPRISAVSQG